MFSLRETVSHMAETLQLNQSTLWQLQKVASAPRVLDLELLLAIRVNNLSLHDSTLPTTYVLTTTCIVPGVRTVVPGVLGRSA